MRFTEKVPGGFGILMLAAFLGACSFPLMSNLGEASQQELEAVEVAHEHFV